MDNNEGIKPPPNLPTEDLSIKLDLERRDPPTSEVVEQMRFGLSRIGPLTEAVLNNNGYALAAALPAGVLTAPTRCKSTDRPTNAEIGEMIYEIDTTGMYVWDGSSWVSVGTPGAAAEVYVGSTTTGVSGSNASVVNVGTATSAVLNFTIPRGDIGATGPTGPTGPAGAAATVAVGTTTTGVSGSSASVSNVGSTSAAVLDFTIPRGDTGATGPTGAAATISVSSTTTLAPGSPATVSNVGTSGAAVLTFGIPQGAAGVGVPTGCIIPFGGASLPSADWLWCDGSLVSQSTYSTLYAVLGPNRYGTDTGTDFYLPDLRERFPRGVSSVTAGVTTTNTNTHTHNLSGFSASSVTALGVHSHTTPGHNHTITGGNSSPATNNASANHNHGWNNTGNHDHGFAQSTTPNVNRATGNLATAGNLTHGHSFAGQGAHNHTFGGDGATHTHTVDAHGHSSNTNTDGGGNTGDANLNHSHSITLTTGTAANASHVPAYVEVNYIIKT